MSEIKITLQDAVEWLEAACAEADRIVEINRKTDATGWRAERGEKAAAMFRFIHNELEKRLPRLLSLEEVRAMQPGDSFWVEWRIVVNEEGKIETELEQYVVAPDGNAHSEGSWIRLAEFEFMDKPDYMTRAWSAEPTDEQRRAVRWEAETQTPSCGPDYCEIG